MSKTEYYDLNKPGVNDIVDIMDLNANMDVIDGELHSLNGYVTSLDENLFETSGYVTDLKLDVSAIQTKLDNLDTKTTYEIITLTPDLDLDTYTDSGFYFIDKPEDMYYNEWGWYYKFPTDLNDSSFPFLFKVESIYDEESGNQEVIQYISPNIDGSDRYLGEWSYHRYGHNGWPADPSKVLFDEWYSNGVYGAINIDPNVRDQDADIILTGYRCDWITNGSPSLKDTLNNLDSSIINVVANPVDEPTTELNTIKIGNTVYKLPTGSVTTSTNSNLTILSSTTSISEQGRVDE